MLLAEAVPRVSPPRLVPPLAASGTGRSDTSRCTRSVGPSGGPSGRQGTGGGSLPEWCEEAYVRFLSGDLASSSSSAWVSRVDGTGGYVEAGSSGISRDTYRRRCGSQMGRERSRPGSGGDGRP